MFVAVVDCHVQCSAGRAQPRRVDDDDDASLKVVHCAMPQAELWLLDARVDKLMFLLIKAVAF